MFQGRTDSDQGPLRKNNYWPLNPSQRTIYSRYIYTILIRKIQSTVTIVSSRIYKQNSKDLWCYLSLLMFWTLGYCSVHFCYVYRAYRLCLVTTEIYLNFTCVSSHFIVNDNVHCFLLLPDQLTLQNTCVNEFSVFSLRSGFLPVPVASHLHLYGKHFATCVSTGDTMMHSYSNGIESTMLYYPVSSNSCMDQTTLNYKSVSKQTIYSWSSLQFLFCI